MWLAFRVRATLARIGEFIESARWAVGRGASWARRNRAPAAASLLGVLFLISLAAYVVGGTERVRRVIFFPDPKTHKLVGEEHFVPRAASPQESTKTVVEEILLGPASFELGRLLPQSVRVRSVSLRERVLYVDFSVALLLDAGTIPLGLADVVQGVANNLYFNFPRLKGVYVFVHGQIPSITGFDASNLAYSPLNVR
jgi:hypothetical protein